jgi:hypothetical protein|tara:strand:- start:342 stop:503 length:162 start_codon:yes stop_codon:yes gene_type:complete
MVRGMTAVSLAKAIPERSMPVLIRGKSNNIGASQQERAMAIVFVTGTICHASS